MSEISHLKNTPWDRTIKEQGESALIDYLLAIDSEALVTQEDAEESKKERDEMLSNFPIPHFLSLRAA